MKKTVNKYRANLRRVIERNQSESSLQRDELLISLRSLQGELVQLFPQLNRMSVVGSAAKGRFSERSDVDIVVAGIKKSDYFSLLKFLESKTHRRVDLIVEEELCKEDLAYILTKTEVII